MPLTVTALGGADVRVGETGAGVAGGEAVTGQAVIRQGDRGAGRAVINLVHPCAVTLKERAVMSAVVLAVVLAGVVGRVGAAERDAADGDGLGRADVLVGETGGGVAGGEAVAGEAIVGEGDRGAGGAIINLVAPGGRYAQRRAVMLAVALAVELTV